MGVLHSDGERMTMAHYPLPEEWIWYIQYLYVLLITRQIGYLGPSSGSMKSNCIMLPAACTAEHTCSVLGGTLSLAVSVGMSSECPTNAQNLTDVWNGAVSLILISFFFSPTKLFVNSQHDNHKKIIFIFGLYTQYMRCEQKVPGTGPKSKTRTRL